MDIEEIREGLLLPGKSRVGLAAALGIDVSQISRLLNGKRSLKVHEVESIRAYLYGAVKSGCGETPSDPFAKLKVVRASGEALTHGVEERNIEGVRVQLTTPAKTVADCFRYRRHVGRDVALAALRDYLSQHRAGVNTLVAAARADRTYAIMRPYLEALA